MGIARIPLSRIPIHDDAAIAALAEQKAVSHRLVHCNAFCCMTMHMSGTCNVVIKPVTVATLVLSNVCLLPDWHMYGKNMHSECVAHVAPCIY